MNGVKFCEKGFNWEYLDNSRFPKDTDTKNIVLAKSVFTTILANLFP